MAYVTATNFQAGRITDLQVAEPLARHFPQNTVKEESLPSILDQLRTAHVELLVAHEILDNLQSTGEEEKHIPDPEPPGITSAAAMVAERARLLRERIQGLAQRIGHL